MVRFVSIVLALLSFLSVSWGIRGLVAPAEQYEGAEKLAYWRDHHDEYTALIVGSSALYRGLDPRVVDAWVQRVEPDFKSFNLAARSMRGFEADALLRQAVEIAGDGLRWVILEPQSWTPLIEDRSEDTHRTRDWHDARSTLGNLRVVMNMNMPAGERFELAAFHARLFCYRLSNYGEIERIGETLFGSEAEPYMTAEQIAHASGYLSIERSLGRRWHRRNRAFLDEIDDYRQAMRILERGRVKHLCDAAVELHRRQREWLEARGIEVIYVMPPFASDKAFARGLAKEGEMPRFVDFLDPDRHPDLYDVDARLDADHLKHDAARLFSRRTGNQISAMLADEEEFRP